jgi:trigger factor
VDEEERNSQIERMQSRFGAFTDVEEVSGNDMIKADLMEVDKKEEPVEGGISVTDVSISLEVIKEEKIKRKFLGCRTGDQVVVDVKKAFENETDLAAMLKTGKENLATISNFFRITVRSVSRFEKALVNQDLFDKVYGKDTVKSPEEFNLKVEEELRAAFERNSDFRFRRDAREYYLSKFKKDLPVAFLKRWLLHTNEGKVSADQIEKDFDNFLLDLKWQLIKGKIVRDNELKITENELISHVSDVFRQQFVQYYGIADVPAETLEKYARESLAREEERNRYVESLMENKVYAFIRSTVKLDTKEVTLEKFNKLFE